MSTLVLRPVNDRIIVKPTVESVSPGGIHIPETAEGSAIRRGIVLFVGPGAVGPNGEVRPMQVRKGDSVLYGKYSGAGITIPDDDCQLLVMREDDIFAVIEDGSSA